MDIGNIKPPNHIEPKSLKFHIKPALMCNSLSIVYTGKFVGNIEEGQLLHH